MDNGYKALLQTAPNTKHTKGNYTANLIIEKARGYWTDILDSLGVNVSYLKNKHGSCPVCGGKDRFRFDNKEQRGTFFCNHCGSGDGIKLLQLYHGWSFPETIDRIARLIGAQSEGQQSSTPTHIRHHVNNIISPNQLSQTWDADQRRQYFSYIWDQANPLSIGDPVDCYLRSRGIVLSEFPSVLRYHPQLSYYDDACCLVAKLPAMLAVVQDESNHGITLHRTYLGDGCKADVPKPKKLMSPTSPKATTGAAIRLYEPIDGKLAVAEGIETALAFSIATQIPAWAAISSGGMEKIVLPPSVIDITIAVDNDASGCGEKSASILSRRLLSEGRRVKRVMPPTVGDDFADMLMEGKP